jgi:hypothetical protein
VGRSTPLSRTTTSPGRLESNRRRILGLAAGSGLPGYRDGRPGVARRGAETCVAALPQLRQERQRQRGAGRLSQGTNSSSGGRSARERVCASARPGRTCLREARRGPGLPWRDVASRSPELPSRAAARASVRANRPWAASAHPSVDHPSLDGTRSYAPSPRRAGTRNATDRIETLRSAAVSSLRMPGSTRERPLAAPLHGNGQRGRNAQIVEKSAICSGRRTVAFPRECGRVTTGPTLSPPYLRPTGGRRTHGGRRPLRRVSSRGWTTRCDSR